MDQLSFFNNPDTLPTNVLEYLPHFFDRNESEQLLQSLIEQTPWKQETLFIYGRHVKTPRLTAWYGDKHCYYKYSGQRFAPLPWTDALLIIKHKIEPAAKVSFNSVLLNYYRDGSDSMGWHADDERELGINPVIASVNFGQTRRFDLRNKTDHKLKHSVNLEDGSLLLMKGDLQHQWEHQVPKTIKAPNARINLTFRTIILT